MMDKKECVEAFIEARFDRHEAGENLKARKAASRRMWEAARDALSASSNDVRFVRVDAEIADWLAFNIEELLSNITPSELSDIKRKGKPNDHKVVKDAIKTAVTYYQFLVSQGAKDPVKRVRKKFKVSDDAVRNWVNDAPDNLWTEYVPSRDPSYREQMLLRSVERATKIHQGFSQSQHAIRNRARSID